MNNKAVVFTSIGAAIVVISVMLAMSIFSVASKNFALDVHLIKDNQNLFNAARVIVTNTGKLALSHIRVIYDDRLTDRIDSLSPGQKLMLSPPSNSS